MKDKLKKLESQILAEVKQASNLNMLKEIEVKFLGRKGELTQILKGLAGLRSDEKKEIGKEANQVKIKANQEIKEKQKELGSKEFNKNIKKEWIDVTLPAVKDYEVGHLHILSQVQNQIDDIFESMGFIIADGPELESEYYNFDALNIPADHPARDMWDTVFIKEQSSSAKASDDKKNIKAEEQNRLLLRTHTSPVQIRAMKKYGAPLSVIVPGTVYRYEATDARHEHTFMQVEGLMIGENISLTSLKGVMDSFLSKLIKKNIKTRYRPGYFPFVEPGLELDLSCILCNGKGCAVCKGTGWLEFMGAGMVHPNVLKAGGVNAKKYQGFAFGFGLERLVMLLYGIDDIRLFRSGDLRFLKQF